MFTKVSFQNLRCFKDFTLENLTPITLLSGRNNVGKTTVLEGIFLLLTYRSANVFHTMNIMRGFDQFSNSSYPWEDFFPDMDAMIKKMSISATDNDDGARTLTFSKDSRFSLAALPTAAQPLLQMLPERYALKFTHEYESEHKKDTGHFFLTPNGLSLHSKDFPSLRPPSGFYIGLSTYLPQQIVAERLGNIEIKNKKEQLIKNLRFLHEEISDVFSVPIPGALIIYSRLDSGKTLPVRAMGDGINKLLHYLSAMIANPGGVFLLDEVETGFHYSFYPKLWELVARVAKETGSQIFATTHSDECISAAVDGVSKVAPELLTYIRLGKKNNDIVPYSFSERELASALDREMEVR